MIFSILSLLVMFLVNLLFFSIKSNSFHFIEFKKKSVTTPVIEPKSTTENASTNQTDSLSVQNDTNSTTTKNEISPLKRDANEIANTDEQTPARKKSKRIDKFKEESEALIKSFGLKEGTDSEKRLTRSRTRGTPVSTPVLAKPVSINYYSHFFEFKLTFTNKSIYF